MLQDTGGMFRFGVCWNHLFEPVSKDSFVQGGRRPGGSTYVHRLRGSVVIPAVKIPCWLQSHQDEWPLRSSEGKKGSSLPTLGSLSISCKSLEAAISIAVLPTSQAGGLRGTAL
jgi:hypothetical protein